MDILPNIQKVIVWIVPLIFAVTLHEVAHAYMAKKYGDNTAILLGRLSINPMKHIDIVGTLIVPFLGIMLGGVIFGWAKPIPINYHKLQDSRRSIFWISFAGPLVNLAQALLWALVLRLVYSWGNVYISVPVSNIAQAGIVINISLMVLNLLPILPLDGGRMLACILPRNLVLHYNKIEPYGLWILLFLMVIGGLNCIIHPIYSLIDDGVLLLIFN